MPFSDPRFPDVERPSGRWYNQEPLTNLTSRVLTSPMRYNIGRARPATSLGVARTEGAPSFYTTPSLQSRLRSSARSYSNLQAAPRRYQARSLREAILATSDLEEASYYLRQMEGRNLGGAASPAGAGSRSSSSIRGGGSSGSQSMPQMPIRSMTAKEMHIEHDRGTVATVLKSRRSYANLSARKSYRTRRPRGREDPRKAGGGASLRMAAHGSLGGGPQTYKSSMRSVVPRFRDAAEPYLLPSDEAVLREVEIELERLRSGGGMGRAGAASGGRGGRGGSGGGGGGNENDDDEDRPTRRVRIGIAAVPSVEEAAAAAAARLGPTVSAQRMPKQYPLDPEYGRTETLARNVARSKLHYSNLRSALPRFEEELPQLDCVLRRNEAAVDAARDLPVSMAKLGGPLGIAGGISSGGGGGGGAEGAEGAEGEQHKEMG